MHSLMNDPLCDGCGCLYQRKVLLGHSLFCMQLEVGFVILSSHFGHMKQHAHFAGTEIITSTSTMFQRKRLGMIKIQSPSPRNP